MNLDNGVSMKRAADAWWDHRGVSLECWQIPDTR